MSSLKLQALQLAANDVIAAIDATPPEHVSDDVLASIQNQMIFIREKAAAGKSPSAELPAGTTFTYAMLASRELASPDELVLKVKIDKVQSLF